MLSFALLVASLWVCASSDVPADVMSGCGESQWLCSILEQMQRQMAAQGHVIASLEARLAEQESVNVQQEARLQTQETLIRHQEKRLRAQDANISHQNRLIWRQRKTLSKLNVEREQSAKDLHDLQLKMDALLLDRKADRIDVSNLVKFETPSVSHDVKARADDSGQLGVVVTQMSQQLTTMGADIQALRNTVLLQNQSIHDSHGASTYVRWGSSSCGGGAQVVYSGVVGGEHDTHAGGAVNYLCLTLSPVLSDHAHPAPVAYLYGAEFETGDSHQDKDPVCAVCKSSLSTTLMIPGTNVCTPGWTKQYDGLLMAGYYAHPAASEYICVDSAMESRLGGDASFDGKLLYYTIAQCGSLPCEPYVNNKVVTCVVCSQ